MGGLMESISIEDGEKLVKFARKVIENHLYKKPLPKLSDFKWDYGVFVTIEEEGDLRGCIGYIEPVYDFETLLKNAAIAAATEDYRFLPVSISELDKITIEVSLLSKPQLIPKPYEKNIKIGTDGLIIEYGPYRGLLLPIVAVEEKWGPKEFLENVSLKAGLHKDAWKDPNANLFKFTTIVFKEKTPNGKVERVM